MKKNFFQLLFCIMVFTGCSKENEDVTPYLKGKMNDTPFNGTLYLHAYPSSGGGLQMSGVYENGSIIMVVEPFNNMTGERMVNQNNYIQILYLGTLFYAGSITPGTPSQGTGKISISRVTDQYVQGTFECVAPIDPSYGASPPLTITKGEFMLKRS